MYRACSQRKLAVAKWLFARGASKDVRTPCRDGSTSLYIACKSGCIQTAKWLVENGAAADINARGDHQFTPLHAALTSRHTWITYWLLRSGAELRIPMTEDGHLRFEEQDEQDERAGWSAHPFFQVCISGDLELAKCLHSYGMAEMLNTADPNFYEALECGIWNRGHKRMLRWLDSVGVPIYKDGH